MVASPPPRRRRPDPFKPRSWPARAWNWVVCLPWYGQLLLCALLTFPAYKLGQMALELAWAGVVVLVGLVMGALIATALFLGNWLN